MKFKVSNQTYEDYIFYNYLSRMDKDSLLWLFKNRLPIDSLVKLGSEAFELPFKVVDGEVILQDPDVLLRVHTEEFGKSFGECDECDDDEEVYDSNDYEEEDDGEW